VTDLAHQPEIPVVDPRGWRPLGRADQPPVAVAVPILDEHHGIVAALDTLVRNARARAAIGDAARSYWRAHHTLDAMADAYVALVADAMARDVPRIALPPHLGVEGDERVAALLAPFGLAPPPPA
jgi:hypothetical protein